MFRTIFILIASLFLLVGCSVKKPFSSGIRSGKVLFFTHELVLGSNEIFNKVYHLDNGGKVGFSKETENDIDIDVGDYIIVNFNQPQSIRVTKKNGEITAYQYDQFKNLKVIKIHSIEEKKEVKAEIPKKKVAKKQEEVKITAENWR